MVRLVQVISLVWLLIEESPAGIIVMGLLIVISDKVEGSRAGSATKHRTRAAPGHIPAAARQTVSKPKRRQGGEGLCETPHNLSLTHWYGVPLNTEVVHHAV